MSTQPGAILVAVDYSPQSLQALDAGVRAALAQGVRHLHFVHVQAENAAATEESCSQMQTWLQSELGRYSDLPPHVAGHVATGDAASQIVLLAADLNAELVVLGSRGRTGLARAVLGSVAETVARRAGCSVLVARPRSHEGVVEIEPACPRCVEARASSGGATQWCEQHLERHGRRHTYHYPRSESWTTQRLIK